MSSAPIPTICILLALLAGLGPSLVLGEEGATPEVAEAPLPWPDRSVQGVTDFLLGGVGWFDDLFDGPSEVEPEPHALFARWRHEFRYRQHDGFDYGNRLYFQADLPSLEGRVKLIFANYADEFGEDEDEEPSPLMREEDKEGEFGLRYDLPGRRLSDLSFGVGLKTSPLSPKFRLRHRRTWPLTQDVAMRLTSSGSWNRGDGFGAKLRWDLERSFSAGRLLRWQNSLQVEQDDWDAEGVNWASELRYLVRLRPGPDLYWEASVHGDSEPEVDVGGYRLRARLRQQFLRPWLFIEVGPEIEWPRWENPPSCNACFGLFLRLEIQFKGEG
jgi:hypothetical protein